MRIGMAVIDTAHWPETAERAQRIEGDGFDLVMTGDHLRHPSDESFPLLDGWSVLAAWATVTDRIRLAMHVSNAIYRHPALLARQAVAVDRISGGRLDLGIGGGLFETDHEMAGVPMWTPGERVARTLELVEAVDGMLRGTLREFAGRWYRARSIVMFPRPIQSPRPPLVIAAHGPRMLGLAARYADVWSSFGGYGIDPEEFFALTRERAATLGRACEEIGRDPGEVERSVLVHHSAFDPWRSVSAFREIASRFAELGVGELVFYDPPPERRDVYEAVVADVLPEIRTW